MLDRNFTAAKWLTLIVSVIVTLIGAAHIGVGIFGLVNPLGNDWIPMSLPITVIVVGALVVLFSVVGCIGSILENRSFLIAFSVLLSLTFLSQIVVASLAISHRGESLNTAIDSRWTGFYEERPKLIRDIEDRYGCCGLLSLNDRAYPKTHNLNRTCAMNPDFGYNRSCLAPLHAELSHHQTSFAAGIFTLAGLLLLGLLPVIYMARRTPSAEDRTDALLEEHERLLNSARTRSAYGSNAAPS